MPDTPPLLDKAEATENMTDPATSSEPASPSLEKIAEECFKEVEVVVKVPRFTKEKEHANGTKYLAPATEELLVTSAYFAITTLSTVGYGDMYPISEMEKITVVVIMLSGVAFFSYIMGNFIEIISNQEQKMGHVDKSGDLDRWMIEL